jgi:hypothetical protein
MGRALDGSDVFFATGVTHLQKCRAPNACDIYATSWCFMMLHDSSHFIVETSWNIQRTGDPHLGINGQVKAWYLRVRRHGGVLWILWILWFGWLILKMVSGWDAPMVTLFWVWNHWPLRWFNTQYLVLAGASSAGRLKALVFACR